MYQELFSLSYQHEYFNSASGLNLHCKLSKDSNELTKAMDAVLIARNNGFKYLWNDSRYSREEVLREFSGKSLVVYLNPLDTEQFLNITDQFPIQYTYSKNINGQEKSKNCLYLHLVHVNEREDQQLKGLHQPVDKLLFASDIENLDKLDTIDITETSDTAQQDSEIAALYQLARRKPLIAMVVPIDQLDKEKSEEYHLTFKARSVFVKYYFLNLNNQETALRIAPQQKRSQSEKSVVSFSRAEPWNENGSLVPTFVSDLPIKLKQKPELLYQLVNERNGVEEVVMDALPQPNIQQYFKHNHPQQGPITVLEAFVK